MDFVLTLVRHGQSEANARCMLAGYLDVGLTEHGVMELEELRKCVDYPKAEAYFSSPLGRCIRTCSILFPDADPIIVPEVHEIGFGSLEGRVFPSKAAMQEYFSRCWIVDEPLADEETMGPAMKRISSALLGIVEGCGRDGRKSAIVVMHSGVMRSAIISLFGLDRREFLRMEAPNGLGYTLLFDGMRPSSYRKIERKMPATGA